MEKLRWNELFKALFLAGFLSVLVVWICGIIWAGVPALMGFSWLFCGFRKKVAVFMKVLRREFWQEIGESFNAKTQEISAFLKGTKRFIWDKNQARITTIIGPIIFLVLFFLWKPLRPSLLLVNCGSVLILWSLLVLFVVCIGYNKGGPIATDRQIGKFFIWGIPKFLFWTGWKLLLKVTILTIRTVHSRELAAVAMYSLGGMGYIIAFPPFGLVPATVFLLAIGCGLFTGAFGVAVHKVLLTTLAQIAFAKVESW